MDLRKRLLRNSRLYLILDTQVNSLDELFEITKKSVESGVDIFQIRDKSMRVSDSIKFSLKVKKILNGKALFIVNDRVDLAMACGADGVHLGQDDLPVDMSRKIAGSKMLIGVSCQTLEHVKKAQKQGADYIGFGSVFKTLTKPDRRPMDLKRLKTANDYAKIPLFAIGGINHENVSQIMKNGISRIAVCREICQSKDIEYSIKQLRNNLN